MSPESSRIILRSFCVTLLLKVKVKMVPQTHPDPTSGMFPYLLSSPRLEMYSGCVGRLSKRCDGMAWAGMAECTVSHRCRDAPIDCRNFIISGRTPSGNMNSSGIVIFQNIFHTQSAVVLRGYHNVSWKFQRFDCPQRPRFHHPPSIIQRDLIFSKTISLTRDTFRYL